MSSTFAGAMPRRKDRGGGERKSLLMQNEEKIIRSILVATCMYVYMYNVFFGHVLLTSGVSDLNISQRWINDTSKGRSHLKAIVSIVPIIRPVLDNRQIYLKSKIASEGAEFRSNRSDIPNLSHPNNSTRNTTATCNDTSRT